MPIKQYEENTRLPVIGKIRLGIRKTAQNGNEYPSETQYFVLADAPDVEKVYGKEPTELDIMFPADDKEVVMPYYNKWYAGGVRDKDGNIIGGKLQCYGDGETANFLAKRDPVTRVVPTRQCLSEKCPDWKTATGIQQCKAAMSLYVLLPRVSLLGVYQIDTTSKIAIQSFVNQINLILTQWQRLRGIPFTLYRDPTNTSFVDPKSGKEKQSIHYIMKIRPNESFAAQFGQELQAKVSKLLLNTAFQPDTGSRPLLEAPMEDHYPVAQQAPAVPSGIEAVAEDQGLAALFSELCELKKKSNTPKMRLLTARKFEKEQDPKAALKTYLEQAVLEAKPKPTTQTPPPAANADGLI